MDAPLRSLRLPHLFPSIYTLIPTYNCSNFPKTLVKMYNDFVLTSLLVGAAAQSPDLLFNPQRQRMREPIHVKDDLYPIMCDVCELVAFSVYFDTMEKLKVRHQ